MNSNANLIPRSHRSPMLLTANLEIDGVSHRVKLRNLSEKGALVEGEYLPPEGSETYFERKDLRLKSRVVWVEGQYAGVAFATNLKPEDVLRNIPPPRPETKLDFRRPGLACRPLTSYERRMLDRWMTAAPMGALGE